MQVKHGNQFYLLGSTANENIIYPGAPNFKGRPITVSFWFLSKGTAQASIWGIEGPVEWHFTIEQWSWGGHGETIGLNRNFSGDTKYIFWSKALGDPIPTDTWIHCVVGDDGTSSSSDGFCYINGIEETTVAGSQSGGGTEVEGGAYHAAGYAPGGTARGVAHLAVWDRHLEPHEVVQLPYRSPKFVPQGLKFYDPLTPPLPSNKLLGTSFHPGLASINDVTITEGFPHVEQPTDIQFWMSAPPDPTLVVDNLSQSNTVEVALLPLYFEDGWESGDTSKWDSVNGSPRVNGSAAIDGSYGLEVNYDDGSHYAVKEHKNNGLEQRFTVEFDIDENDADAGDGASITHILLDDGGVYCGMVRITHDSGENYMQMRFRNDSGTWISGTWYAPASWPVLVEADFDFANGDFKMWVDGTLRANNTGYDTDTRYPDAFRAGNGLSGGYVSGSIYTDNHKLYSGPRVGPTNITVDNLSQSNTVDKLAIDKVIALENLSQSNLVEKVSIEPEGSAVGYALAQANIVSVPTLTQVHNITVNNLSQSNLVESPWVNTAYQLETVNLSLSGIVSKPSLTQVHNISVTNISQQGYVQTAYLGEWWTEVHEEVGPVTIEYSVVGLIEQLWEDYGIIDMEHDLDTYIDQALEESGEIGQTLDLEAPIAITHEQDGEI